MDNGWTAHMWASMEGHLAVARLLLQHGADAELVMNMMLTRGWFRGVVYLNMVFQNLAIR